MSKKSSRVVLTLLGSAVLGVGCSQSTPVPADSMVGHLDFEKLEDEPQSGQQSTDAAGAAGVAPGTVAEQSSHSHGMGRTSHYSRGFSMWPLLWGLSSRSPSMPSQPMSRPMTPPPVPRGPSHVVPPPIPSHGSQASNATTTHTTTTHSSGSSSHTSSHGFGSTGHAVSGGS